MPPVAHRSDLACSPDDTAIFFPDGPTVTAYKKAKRICRPCPARDDCAAWALRTGQPDGVWGGLDPRERRKLQEKKDTPPRAS
jgi:WhiB family redox-sensing transcriptional regulator